MLSKILKLLGAVVLSLATSANAGIVLEASTDALELVTSSAASIDYNCSWTDNTTTLFTPGKSAGNVASATTTTVVSAPAASTQRNILNCTFKNASTTTANTLTLQRDVSATNRTMYTGTVAAGETLILSQEGEFALFSPAGVRRVQNNLEVGYNGRTFSYQKVGTAKDSAGYWIAYMKDTGFPGAYNLGAPGLNGWTTDCSTASNAAEPAGAAQIGSHLLQDPASGSYYLTSAIIAGSVAEIVQLIDITWYNTGLVVTTTTGQAVTFPTPQARDINGSTNGEGIEAALLTTTANTNAATIANTTLTYTDSEGNAGNTATFSALVGWQAPATPVIGTWMPFQLAAGDRGIRSVQTVTLGTSYGAGALSLVTFRPLLTIPNAVASIGGVVTIPSPGIRVHTNSCIAAIAVGSASASTLAGSYTIMER